ncbi:hypothetical protein QBC39DRAFT_296909 [Podospora conica]|nr:hypothetical protein QBC39DRAFT_296909 [Schizothecium conicum]
MDNDDATMPKGSAYRRMDTTSMSPPAAPLLDTNHDPFPPDDPDRPYDAAFIYQADRFLSQASRAIGKVVGRLGRTTPEGSDSEEDDIMIPWMSPSATPALNNHSVLDRPAETDSSRFHAPPHSAGLDSQIHRRRDSDDETSRPEKTPMSGPDAEFTDTNMPDIFRFAHPSIYDRDQKEKYSPCHSFHRDISTLIRHLARPAHRLLVTKDAISSFDIEDPEYPHRRVGVCRRCWRQFPQRDAFQEHLSSTCENASKRKREKWQVLYESFTPLMGPEPSKASVESSALYYDRREDPQQLERSPSRQSSLFASSVDGPSWDEPTSTRSGPVASFSPVRTILEDSEALLKAKEDLLKAKEDLLKAKEGHTRQLKIVEEQHQVAAQQQQEQQNQLLSTPAAQSLIQNHTSAIFSKQLPNFAERFGGVYMTPPDMMENFKKSCLASARSQVLQQILASQRSAGQQMALQGQQMAGKGVNGAEITTSMPADMMSVSNIFSSNYDPNLGAHSTDSTDDSEVSDVESILSEAHSTASSQSSIAPNIDLGGVHVLKILLLTNAALKPVYDVAISKVGPEKFQRNFRRLLVRYGRALSAEATAPVQSKAAHFVRYTALRVSVQIRDAITDQGKKQSEVETIGTKALDDYLRKIQDVDDSGDEDSEPDESDHDHEELSVQTLDAVKNFMVSSKAFRDFCQSLRLWLGVETSQHQVEMEDTVPIETEILEAALPESPGELAANTEAKEQHKRQEMLGSESGTLPSQRGPDESLQKNPPGNGNFGKQTASSFSARKIAWNRFRSGLTSFWQPRLPDDQVGVSWTCRCGETLRLQVPGAHSEAAVSFAQHAAGPNQRIITNQSSAGTTPILLQTLAPAATNPTSQAPDLTPSRSNISATTTDSSSTTSTSNSAASGPSPPSTAPSDASLSHPEPFLPAGTKKFLLLCVNTPTRPGILRKLANVDITDVECSSELFSRLRTAYSALRPRPNPFLIPKTMHYIKFQLLFLQKSGQCVGSYEVDSIPSLKEVLNQEYALSPCPPQIGKLPLPPDIFMHAFLDPGDHLGGMAVDMLPKKLWCELTWDERTHGRWGNVPEGWGFYVVEGINWGLVSWCAGVALVGATVLTVVWSAVLGDVQGGTGLGQYCLAALAFGVSVWFMKDSRERKDSGCK